jgi:glutathionylspermidine synthase
MRRSNWLHLAELAERLSKEAFEAELELASRPEMLASLGMPRKLRRALNSSEPLTPAAGRIIRFDFHPTTDGWRISEANSDVPGGYTEASFFTQRMAEAFPSWRPAGNPGSVWSAALAEHATNSGVIALLSAPGFMEDHQVLAYLAKELNVLGCRTILAKPEQIKWQKGRSRLETKAYTGALDVLVRFYQSEWLARLGPNVSWQSFFRGGKTPVANPGLAALVESKRFPLVWNNLKSQVPTWRALLPATYDPRQLPRKTDFDSFVLKAAYCNTGDAVFTRDRSQPLDWFLTLSAAKVFPGRWVWQKKFESIPILTPHGPRHVCIGVYTVNGNACGAYARLSPQPVINYSAIDAALLIESDD